MFGERRERLNSLIHEDNDDDYQAAIINMHCK
jgi:hypothetical protein